MTRIAFISDVHADVHAVTDAIAQAERLGCAAIVCAGDLVDGGLFPNQTIALLRARSIPCIRGNHDRWRVADWRAAEGGAREALPPDDAGRSGAELSPATLEFLAALPNAWDAVFEGVRVAVRHGTPRSDMDGIYPGDVSLYQMQHWLEDAQADVLIVGHTHQPFVLSALGSGIIANPGALLRSVGEQRSAGWAYDVENRTYVPTPISSGGTFGVLDLPSRIFTVHRASDGSEVEILRISVGIRDTRGSY